ncbi:MAG: protein-glutamate O-methyltransferase CheR [Candidatus Magnetomorum sp.]|nr:protein-glutamate O-methyltransferase CheR [Candidatus Magnetomorum sp.]
MNTENQNIEVSLLLEAIYQKYGYDFRDYSRASIKRRIKNTLSMSGLKNVSEMQHKVLYDERFFNTLLMNFSINVTEMFRDPIFYQGLVREVISNLSKRSFVRIWHAGCATGEEAYSMAIILKEAGIYERSRIYATDFNEDVIRKAREGIYSIDSINKYGKNYTQATGNQSFSKYYTARYDYAIMDRSLRKNIIFSDYNLVTDHVFCEMDLIVCRNVLIYFNKKLQNRVIHLFIDSLTPNGYLCLGLQESIKFSDYADQFKEISRKEKIYQKI